MIRPLDLQNTILQSIQSAPAVQRAEEGPRLAAQAAQAAFSAELTLRDESVAAVADVSGNRVNAKPDKGRERSANREKRGARVSFEEIVDDAAGIAAEPAHLIDVIA